METAIGLPPKYRSLTDNNEPTNKLYELLAAINNHESGLNEYHTSEERVAALKKSRQKNF